MNPASPIILSLALLFGGAGAVFAFESAAQSDAPRTSVAATTESTATTAEATPAARTGRRHHRGSVVRWAPCPAGATLVDDACVTDVVKTVTLPTPAAQAVSHSSGTAPSSHSSGDDDHAMTMATTTEAMTTATTTTAMTTATTTATTTTTEP